MSWLGCSGGGERKSEDLCISERRRPETWKGTVSAKKGFNFRDVSGEMSKLKISDSKPSTPTRPDRRTSQRKTRSASRQLPENDDKSSKKVDGNGNGSPGMWTPGTPRSNSN